MTQGVADQGKLALHVPKLPFGKNKLIILYL